MTDGLSKRSRNNHVLNVSRIPDAGNNIFGLSAYKENEVMYTPENNEEAIEVIVKCWMLKESIEQLEKQAYKVLEKNRAPVLKLVKE